MNFEKINRSLSHLGNVGCKLTAAVHFSPSFCPIAGLWTCKSGKNCPRCSQFSLSTAQVRQASRIYLKYILYLVVLFGYSFSNAGSYDDFFVAVKADDGSAVAALLQRGFDGNTRDPNGLTGLHLAVREKSLKVATVLIGWGKINVEARTATDESPLMLASLSGLLDLSKAMIAKGADVNKPGWTPLHYAATRGHLPVMALLLDNHAYIDASSPNGTTPLMMAAFYGTPAAVKLLLEAGADPLIKNDQGLSAIDFAHKNSRFDSAEIIAAFVRARLPKGKW